MENVVIDPACFIGLVTSAVEAYNRETNGFLIGALKLRPYALVGGFDTPAE